MGAASKSRHSEIEDDEATDEKIAMNNLKKKTAKRGPIVYYTKEKLRKKRERTRKEADLH